MKLEQIKSEMKDYARDIRLNVESVLSPEGAPGLTQEQIYGIALACAYATKSTAVVGAFEKESREWMTAEMIEGAKGAATMMAMNNVYYRFLHLAEDAEVSKLPARLRMNFIAKPGIPKVDFELMCLAVSAMSGCGMCIKSHVHEARKGGVSTEGIQSTARIASVVQAISQAVVIG